MQKFKSKLRDINAVIDLPSQNWLFGAGISRNANIPLMHGLTKLVSENLSKHKDVKDVYQSIKSQFKYPDKIHIEHILSHIGDLIALINRTGKEKIIINDYTYKSEDFTKLYDQIIESITKIVRYGYCEEKRKIGTVGNPEVDITEHINFVDVLFNRKNNQEKRGSINFFTTNYDTLLEDALSLSGRKVIDGFVGSAVAYWNPEIFVKEVMEGYSVFKLHGSVDWQRDSSNVLYRTRYGTTYLENGSNTMIYPQATKYVETQKDPFAHLFDSFRRKLKGSSESYLGICGYSFGDEHINNEIDYALNHARNNLTLIVFIKENEKLHTRLENWLNNVDINERIYILTEKGIHHKGDLFTNNTTKEELDWWKFDGLTRLLREGENYL